MKKVIFILFIVTPVLFTTLMIAQDNKEEKIPPGMEIQKIGGTPWLVPKGMRIHKEGDLIVLETANEYVARKLSDMEERLAKIEAEQEILNAKFEKLNEVAEMNVHKQ